MKSKPYPLIIVLLSLSLFGVLLMQGFWMQRFYAQKEKEFNTLVHSVLGRVGDLLNERENLQVIKRSFRTDSTLNKETTRTRIVISSSHHAPVSALPETPGAPAAPAAPAPPIAADSNHWTNEIFVFDSAFESGSSGPHITLNKNSKGWTTKTEEIKHLLDKMKTEIEVLESSSVENISEEQLSGLLKKELDRAGIQAPFEYALKKQTSNTDDILKQSPGFDSTSTTFKADLSAKRVFSNNRYLYLQFPRQNNLVYSGIKSMLLLSLFFTFIIVAVFYYSISLLLKQKKLGEIKNDFINNMTHELKTPLATLSLATDALANPLVRNTPEKFDEYTRILKEESSKLNTHVEKVLQIALMDKGELQLNKKETDLIALVDDCVRSFSLVIQNSGASITKQFNVKSLSFLCDPFHFSNALSNLIDNALKYSEGIPHVLIRIEQKANSLELSVSDEGIGIPPEKLSKVFDKFYRVQGGNLHDVKGFGLGLSYVKSIVEAHGGRISVKSEKGKGSEFTLQFAAHA
ncbi:MAG: HAMP domain-containing histidine kinase [Bacteroidia bacterium]|nr:HAMP domain-containing histidine kinase [Bacteroidia bacterium]